MKKHIKLILTACLALCMVLCLGLAVACQKDNDSDDSNTFTITVLNEDGTPAKKPEGEYANLLQYCAESAGAQGSCIMANPDSNGKIKVDLSTDTWKNAETMHIMFLRLEDGYKAYDAQNNAYGNGEGPNVDFHTVKSITFTIKEEGSVIPPIEAEDIEIGYQYSVRGLSEGTPKAYKTIVDSSEAIFEADVHGGEFELSVISGTTTTVLETLNADNTSVIMSLNSSDYGGAGLAFMITPKNADSTQITFFVCPVYEIGTDGKVINAPTEPDVFKVYFTLDGTAELVFENPWGGPITSDQIGLPVTVKIGASIVETWNTLEDIAPITVTDKGYVPCTFEFDNPDEANLYLLVKNANLVLDSETIVLGQEVNVTVENMFDDSAVYTFVTEESGTYLVTFTGSNTFTVQFSIPSTGWMSDTYFYENSVEGVVKVKLDSYTEYEVRFGTENWDVSDSYTAVITKSTDPDDDDDNGGNGNGGETGENQSITLGELTSVTVPMFGKVTYTFLPAETGTYVITIYSNNTMLDYNGNRIDPTNETTGQQVYEIEITVANEAITLTFSSVAFDIDTFNVIITKK